METQRKKRLSKVRQMKNNLILDAALELFSKNGYHETRLEDIAFESGFSKASLYNYYADKETIFFALALREYEKVNSMLSSEGSHKISDDVHYTENLYRYLSAIIETFQKHLSFLLTLDEIHFFTIIEEPTKKVELSTILDELLEEKRSIRANLRQLIDNGKSNREIDDRITTDRIISSVQALLYGLFREWRSQGVLEESEKALRELVLFIEKGIQSPRKCNS